MRILVFGGSFDPPHKGHSALLGAATRQLKPDRILIVPAYQAPLKGRPGASAGDRLRLIRLGLLPSLSAKWRRKTRLELSEHKSLRKIYTVDTLARLKTLHPKAELNFVVGSDSAAGFQRWKNPAKLKTLARWWTAIRPGADRRPPVFFGKIHGRMPDISSTDLRRRLAFGETIKGVVAPSVEGEIKRRGLYGGTLLAFLEHSLKPGRFEHIICVAELAEALAKRWGLDTEKARLAGLLHDIGRSVPKARMPAYARRRRLKVPALSGIIKNHPLLLHPYISEDLARRRFAIEDEEILSAVRRHTLGDTKMSRLDRLLFVADACSTDRRFPGVEKLRRLGFKDLDRAFAAVVRNKLDYVRQGDRWVHPMARRLWNSLKK